MPDLGPQLMMTTGLISSPQVGTTGLTVADAAGVTRVQLGQIGTVFGQNYGLKVVASDGTTVIIDGTSNMFKIAASGTISTTIPAGGTNSATVTLTGLGALPTNPAHLSFLHTGADLPTSGNIGFLIRSRGRYYVAATSGGSPTTQTIVVTADCQIIDYLDGSNQCVIQIGGDISVGGGAGNYWGRWYVFQEAGI